MYQTNDSVNAALRLSSIVTVDPSVDVASRFTDFFRKLSSLKETKIDTCTAHIYVCTALRFVRAIS